MMDCRTFEERLDRWIDAEPRDPEQEAALRHAAGCPRCRELLAIARGELDLLGPEEHERMARSILEATSGSACAGIEDRLCDVVDGFAGEEDTAIVRLHLRHCSGCRALAESLALLREDLSWMAEIQPDDRFVADVLAATSERRTIRRRFADAAMAWWSRQIRRPRFAVEAAYTIATVFVILFGPPTVPSFEDGPGEAGTNPIQAVEGLLAAQGIEPGAVAGDLWNSTVVPLGQGAARVSSWGIERGRDVGGTVEISWETIEGVATKAWHGDLFGAWNAVVDGGDRIAALWRGGAEDSEGGIPQKETEPRDTRGRTDDEPIENGSE